MHSLNTKAEERINKCLAFLDQEVKELNSPGGTAAGNGPPLLQRVPKWDLPKWDVKKI